MPFHITRYLTAKSLEFYSYVEQETATGKKRRPVFDQMMAEAMAGKFQILVIWALGKLYWDVCWPSDGYPLVKPLDNEPQPPGLTAGSRALARS